MTDTIRSVDKNHLVFVGAQYFGELTDIPYRPGTGGIEPYLRTEYFKAVKQMAMACGQYCWNVWPLTFYDFNPYPADDAMILRRGGIATLATEFGFTLGTPERGERPLRREPAAGAPDGPEAGVGGHRRRSGTTASWAWPTRSGSSS